MDVRRMPRWAAVAAGCAMVCSPDAWAGKSVAECQAFAHQSLDMKRDALARNCGFPDNWIGTWQQNFDYCRSAEASSTDQIVHRRNVMMNMCTNVCPGYAAAAMNDIRIATEGGCLQGNTLVGVTGGAGRCPARVAIASRAGQRAGWHRSMAQCGGLRGRGASPPPRHPPTLFIPENPACGSALAVGP